MLQMKVLLLTGLALYYSAEYQLVHVIIEFCQNINGTDEQTSFCCESLDAIKCAFGQRMSAVNDAYIDSICVEKGR